MRFNEPSFKESESPDVAVKCEDKLLEKRDNEDYKEEPQCAEKKIQSDSSKISLPSCLHPNK